MQTIVVYGHRFHDGQWSDWEHICSSEEIDGVKDSARAKAFERGGQGQLLYCDYLEGSRYMFNVAYGTREHPEEGDIAVYGVCVNGMVLGEWGALKEHFEARQSAVRRPSSRY